MSANEKKPPTSADRRSIRTAARRVERAKVALAIITQEERARLFHDLGVCACVHAGTTAAVGGFLGSMVGSFFRPASRSPTLSESSTLSEIERKLFGK